jgi:hypothetical protein
MVNSLAALKSNPKEIGTKWLVVSLRPWPLDKSMSNEEGEKIELLAA